jgi:putative Mg2+ transporter-C (MgtC) family protein
LGRSGFIVKFNKVFSMSELNEQLLILANVAIGSILAGIIGIEREISEKPAGFRTNMIIGGASALLVSLGKSLVNHFADSPAYDHLQFDPLRIIEAIIVGISFLGAGTILKGSDAQVSNLTTAATILYSAGIGVSVALNQYFLAIGITLLALLINSAIKIMERKFLKSSKQNKK